MRLDEEILYQYIHSCPCFENSEDVLDRSVHFLKVMTICAKLFFSVALYMGYVTIWVPSEAASRASRCRKYIGRKFFLEVYGLQEKALKM